jgi:hypothetical protein
MEKLKNNKVLQKIKSIFDKIWTYDILHPFCYAILVTMIVECFNRRNLTGITFLFTHPVIFLANMLIVTSCLSIGMLFKKRTFIYTLISVIWIGLSITNFVIKSVRKTPFTAMDFLVLDDARKVAPMYLTVINMIFIVLAIVLVIVALVFLYRKTGKIKTELSLKRFIILGAGQSLIVILFTYGIITTLLLNKIIAADFGNLSNAF